MYFFVDNGDHGLVVDHVEERTVRNGPHTSALGYSEVGNVSQVVLVREFVDEGLQMVMAIHDVGHVLDHERVDHRSARHHAVTVSVCLLDVVRRRRTGGIVIDGRRDVVVS